MKYSIIVPVFNQLEYTQKCVQSVVAMSYGYDYELIIVANGCTDKTEEWVYSNRDSSIVLCSYKEPLGFGGATNAGMRLSRGEYLILLNNDCVILPPIFDLSWLDLLEQPFAEPKMGITGPLLYWSEITKMWALIFFCVMIHRTVIDKIGFLDVETFPIGAGEDTDFCARAQEAGFLLAQVPSSPWSQGTEHMVGGFPIYHVGEGTLNHIPNWNEKLYWEHREALRRKYADK